MRTPTTREPRLRPARPDEAGVLSALILRSKASWGHDEAFMALARADLELTAAAIAADHVEVLVDGHDPIGLIRLRREDDRAELVDIFVDTPALGLGHGRRLFERAVAIARGWGSPRIELDSDPNAVGFYEAMGMERIGSSVSTVDPARRLPRMRLTLS